jgi:DNA primase
MIKQNSINEVLKNFDIIEVVTMYLPLKKVGLTYKTHCPFHKEKTPSFHVSPQKGIYHCFGCGSGGNSIKFIQEIENISFPQAIEKLANIKNIKLEYEDSYLREDYRDILEILQKLNLWFISNLYKNREALRYLENRGITKETITKFQLGYAPNDYETLEWLKLNNISQTDSLSLGIIQKDGETERIRAKFINRLIFPIFEHNGKIVAFGGRVLDNREPKYLNSPSTNFYTKGSILYGYNFTRSEIAKTGIAIIVEGYIDLIALYQSGIKNVVAPLGTALTESQINILGRGGGKIHLVFDGDKAGLIATRRSVELIAKSDIEAFVTILTNGIDPADLVKNREIDKLKDILSKDNRRDAIEWFLRDIISQYNLSDPYSRRDADKIIKQFISNLKDFLKNKYENLAKELFGEGFRTHINVPNQSESSINYNIKSDGLGEQALLKFILLNKELSKNIINELELFDFKLYREEFKEILEIETNQQIITNENEKFIKIILSETPNYSFNEAELELINIKIQRYENELIKIRTEQISFLDKIERIKNLKFKIVSLEKRKLKI